MQLFVAGIIPGLIGGRRPDADGLLVRGALQPAASRRSSRLRRVWQTFKEAAWAFLLPIIILGGIFGGVVTATEAPASRWWRRCSSGGVISRELDLAGALAQAMIDGAVQTAVVMLLVATSALLGGYLTKARVPQLLARSITELTENSYAVLALLNVLFLVLGCSCTAPRRSSWSCRSSCRWCARSASTRCTSAWC